MTETVLYVEKGTDQMRSTLLAYGLAALLYQTPPAGSSVEVRLLDLGAVYQVRASVEPEALLEWVQADSRLKPLLPAIVKPLSKRDQEREAAGEPVGRKYKPQGFWGRVINYADEKAKPDGLERKNQPRIEGDVDVRASDFPLWAHLCSYFGKGSAMRIGYPLVVHAWHAHQGQQAVALFQLILDCFSSLQNDIEAAGTSWLEHIQPALDYPDFDLFNWTKQAGVSALSVISPTTAQGAFTVTGAKNINTDTPNIFWLEVYLAFAGYMAVAMPYRSGGDALLYYPLPRKIAFARARNIVANYRDTEQVRRLYSYSNSLPRAKVDALSQIAFYRSMVEHFRQNLPDAEAQPWEQVPINAFSGFVGYYYKDISTQIPFDQTTFALPPWLPAEVDAETLDWAQQVLKAHFKVLNNVTGERRGSPPKYKITGDELVVFDSYRSFATIGTPEAWLDFAIRYGVYYFGHMHGTQKLARLRINVFERTLMNISGKQTTNYKEIYDTPGFRAIADAIRFRTVDLLWRTKHPQEQRRQRSKLQVLHGLDADLLRNADRPDLFLEELSGFVTTYSLEREKLRTDNTYDEPWGPEITDEDYYQVSDLVTKFGSRLVAKMLIAAGYTAREWQTVDPAEETDADEETEAE